MPKALFHSFNSLDCEKSTFESLENTDVSIGSLCMAVCVFDVMNKAGACGTSVYDVIYVVI